MSRTQRQAVLLALIQRLRENGSWCGETHIQKSVYFLQELLAAPLDLNFVFYKHGPFSFDLSDEVTALRGDLLLSVLSREPYGPSLWPTEQGEKVLGRFPNTLKTHDRAIRFVAEHLGSKNVAELERLATALYVLLDMPNTTKEKQARVVHQLKPHVAYEEAIAALEAVEGMRSELQALKSP
jgi:uncharacterized protein YwgA